MILGFTQELNNKPTYFVERIWEGLLRFHFDTDKEYDAFMNEHKEKFGKHWDWFPEEHERLTNTKAHTIREDKNDRWKVGTMIDFFINVRQKSMFRFAPVLPVISTQKVMIVWFELFGKRMVRVFIDGKSFAMVKFADELIITGNMLELAQNDGFDTIEDFFAYFNEDFKGKIIHWTDLRY